jgi:hypothetical protein
MRFVLVRKVAPSTPTSRSLAEGFSKKSLAASSIWLSEKRLDRILRVIWQGSISMSGGSLSQKRAAN